MLLELSCCWSLLRVKHQALSYEIEELSLLRGNTIVDGDAVWDSQEALFGILDKERRVVTIKVVILLTALIYHGL